MDFPNPIEDFKAEFEPLLAKLTGPDKTRAIQLAADLAETGRRAIVTGDIAGERENAEFVLASLASLASVARDDLVLAARRALNKWMERLSAVLLKAADVAI